MKTENIPLNLLATIILLHELRAEFHLAIVNDKMFTRIRDIYTEIKQAEYILHTIEVESGMGSVN